MKKLFVLLALLLSLRVISFSYENTYAVIIGIDAYQRNPIVGPVNDAVALCEFLMSTKGGSVPPENICLLLDSNATKSAILTYSKRLFAKAKKDDRVIFYFAGHGGDGFFSPYDFDGWLDSSIQYSDIKSIFRTAKCNTKLMFADACHSGGIKGTNRKKAGVSSPKEINIAIMLSCKANEYSYSEINYLKKGVFTHYLMEGLSGAANRDGNKYITIQELYYYVYAKVKEYFKDDNITQTPQLFGKFDLRLVVAKVTK